MRKVLAYLVVIAGCLNSPVDNVSEVDETIVQPDTVCGLPTQCHPFQCSINSSGVPRCIHSRIADATCASACGGQAICPSGDDGGCINLCSSIVTTGPGVDNCYVNCVNAISRSCQDGVTP